MSKARSITFQSLSWLANLAWSNVKIQDHSAYGRASPQMPPQWYSLSLTREKGGRDRKERPSLFFYFLLIPIYPSIIPLSIKLALTEYLLCVRHWRSNDGQNRQSYCPQGTYCPRRGNRHWTVTKRTWELWRKGVKYMKIYGKGAWPRAGTGKG